MLSRALAMPTIDGNHGPLVARPTWGQLADLSAYRYTSLGLCTFYSKSCMRRAQVISFKTHLAHLLIDISGLPEPILMKVF